MNLCVCVIYIHGSICAVYINGPPYVFSLHSYTCEIVIYIALCCLQSFCVYSILIEISVCSLC